VEYIDPNAKPRRPRPPGFRPDSPVLIDSGPRKEGAKSLSEEEITGALIRSLKSGARNVCVLTGRAASTASTTRATAAIPS
jgi:hypothetical protein